LPHTEEEGEVEEVVEEEEEREVEVEEEEEEEMAPLLVMFLAHSISKQIMMK